MTVPVVVVSPGCFQARVFVVAASRRKYRITVRLQTRNVKTGLVGAFQLGGWVESFSGKMPSARTVGSMARELLREAVLHELDEMLVVDGKRPYDPHRKKRKARRK